MNKITITISALILLLHFNLTAQSQTLLSPTELLRIHKLKDSSAITATLSAKGYTTGYSWDNRSIEKVNNWTFQTAPGEFTECSLRRIKYPEGLVKTLYWISNVYNYKAFIENLEQLKYAFAGISIIDKEAYSVFKRGTDSFFIIQRQDVAKSTYFEVRVN